MFLVTIFRSIRKAERSPLWMPPRPKRFSSGGFATKSTGLKENSLFRTGWRHLQRERCVFASGAEGRDDDSRAPAMPSPSQLSNPAVGNGSLIHAPGKQGGQ